MRWLLFYYLLSDCSQHFPLQSNRLSDTRNCIWKNILPRYIPFVQVTAAKTDTVRNSRTFSPFLCHPVTC